MTITTSDKTYNGSAQTLTSVSASGVSTWTLGYTTSSSSTSPTWLNAKTNLSATNVGTTYYIWVKWTADSNHSNSESGSKTTKTAKISQRTVTITAPTRTNVTYNGSAQTIFAAGSCTAGGTMYYSDTNKTFSTSTWSKTIPTPNQTSAGTYTLYYYCHVSDTTNNTGTNINTIKSINATVYQKAVTYTATNQSKTYNGTALTATNTATLTSGSLVSGHEATVTCSGSQTNAGSSTKTLTSVIIKSGTTDVTSNYNVSYVNGTLTVNKKSTTITYNPSNLTVQALNSATYLNELTRVEYTKPTAGSGSAGCVITSIKNSSGQNATTISLQQPYLRLDASTPVGTYTVTMTASCDNNHTADTVSKSFTVTVVADQANSSWDGVLSLNNTSALSAGEDSRTITWGNIHKTWKYGGGVHSRMSGSANLTISCTNSTYGGLVTLSKTSYSNSSSTTTTTLSKATCGGTTFSSNVTFTIYLRTSDGTAVKSIQITGSKNTSTTTVVSIMYYGQPTLTLVSGSMGAGATTAQMSCNANNLAIINVKYDSTYSTNISGTTKASTSWVLTAQSCVGGATRFSQSGDRLTHTTMGTTVGQDMAVLKLYNLDNNSTTTTSAVVTNNRVHTLTSVSMTYNTANYAASSQNTPTIKYNTSYNYTSGASGGTTTNNTASSITGATFTKSFSVTKSDSNASVNTSTGVVTWNYLNNTGVSRDVQVKCTGKLTSSGNSTSLSVYANAIQSTQPVLRVDFINKQSIPSGVTVTVNSTSGTVGVMNSSTAVNGSFYITSNSTSITFTVVVSGTRGARVVCDYNNGTGTSGSDKTISSTQSGTNQYTGTGTFTVSRSSTGILGQAIVYITVS